MDFDAWYANWFVENKGKYEKYKFTLSELNIIYLLMKTAFEAGNAVLTSAMNSDGEDDVVLEEFSIPGNEEIFNNGHGW